MSCGPDGCKQLLSRGAENEGGIGPHAQNSVSKTVQFLYQFCILCKVWINKISNPSVPGRAAKVPWKRSERWHLCDVDCVAQTTKGMKRTVC